MVLSCLMPLCHSQVRFQTFQMQRSVSFFTQGNLFPCNPITEHSSHASMLWSEAILLSCLSYIFLFQGGKILYSISLTHSFSLSLKIINWNMEVHVGWNVWSECSWTRMSFSESSSFIYEWWQLGSFGGVVRPSTDIIIHMPFSRGLTESWFYAMFPRHRGFLE